ncbi:MAG: protocatechuate 3,4-dioxygenase subunit alpha [Pseudomonadota bacterium]
MRRLKESASQTAGPYIHIGCMPNYAGIPGVYGEDLGAGMITEETAGERISIVGTIHDGAGEPLTDAVIEIWQADAAGRYGVDASGFTGWGRQAADGASGLWRFDTIKPGPVVHPSGPEMAPHITFWIVARGINLGLHTRMYFPEDTGLHAQDPVLAMIEDKSRVQTLIATKRDDNMYRFNIYLQGPEETVFFDV